MYVKATELRLFFQERNLSSRNKESHTAFKIPMVHSYVTPKPANLDMHRTGPRLILAQ